MRPRKSLHTLRSLMEQQALQGLIERRYPATEAADAFAHVLSEQKVGNVVIEFEQG